LLFVNEYSRGAPMNFQKDFEEISKLPMPELAEIMAGREEIGSKANFAKLIYEERQMAKKHEYEKEQIQLQHKLNMALMTKQLRWIKFSAILNALAIIAGVLLGWYLSEIKSVQNPKESVQQTIQSQTKPSTSASRSESESDKIPFKPPKKDEIHK